MAQKTYPSIESGVQGWEALLDEWKQNLSNPLPIFRIDDVTDIDDTLIVPDGPDANRHSIVIVGPTASGSDTNLGICNGVDVKLIPKMAANQIDTVAADLAALKVDFNSLLAKLRATKVIG